MTVASPQASEQPAPQTSPRDQGIKRAAEIYHRAGIRTGNETLQAIATESPAIAAVRDALAELEAGAR